MGKRIWDPAGWETSQRPVGTDGARKQAKGLETQRDKKLSMGRLGVEKAQGRPLVSWACSRSPRPRASMTLLRLLTTSGKAWTELLSNTIM